MSSGFFHRIDAPSPKVKQGNVESATDSIAGSVGAGGSVDLTFNAYMFFAMFHASADAHWSGHSVDAADADSPRMRLFSNSATSYDIDYRYVTA